MSEQLFDPYGILGVGQDADPTSIRRAFRRLAMRWHPDRNADPQATERFKQIRAAFDWLIGDEHEGPAQHDGGGEGEGEDEAAAARGADRHETLELTLEEAMLGCDKPFTLRRQQPCPACDGEGMVALRHTRMCDICHGSGKVRTTLGLEKCHICSGRGFVQRAACEDCCGSGQIQADREVTVHVAAGMLPGEVLRLKGLGYEAEGEGEHGTLFLTLKLREDGLFRLQGRDIHVSQPVGMLRLLAGGRLSLAGPLGPILFDLAPGAASELRLPGRGFPGRGGDLATAGDLVVTLQPCLPEGLDERQISALARVEDTLQGQRATHYPALERWWQAYLASRP